MLLVLSFGSLWVATEFLASRFAFQHALGTPLAPYIYVPWAGFEWMFRFSGVTDPRAQALLGQFWQVWGFLEIATLPIVLGVIVRREQRATFGPTRFRARDDQGGDPAADRVMSFR